MRRRTLIIALTVMACALLGGSLSSSTRAGTPLPCDLTLRFGSRSGRPPGQFHVNLVFTNSRYDTPCRVLGFPDVELIGPAVRVYGSIFSLDDQAGSSQSTLLRLGQSAHALLTLLPPSLPSDRWVPSYIRVVVRTSRGPSLPMALPWNLGPILRQDAATHPGTYVGPLRGGTG